VRVIEQHRKKKGQPGEETTLASCQNASVCIRTVCGRAHSVRETRRGRRLRGIRGGRQSTVGRESICSGDSRITQERDRQDGRRGPVRRDGHVNANRQAVRGKKPGTSGHRRGDSSPFIRTRCRGSDEAEESLGFAAAVFVEPRGRREADYRRGHPGPVDRGARAAGESRAVDDREKLARRWWTAPSGHERSDGARPSRRRGEPRAESIERQDEPRRAARNNGRRGRGLNRDPRGEKLAADRDEIRRRSGLRTGATAWPNSVEMNVMNEKPATNPPTPAVK